MNILAIDTFGDVLSLSLSSPFGTQCVSIDSGLRHSELLMDWVDRLFSSASLEPNELNLVACMKGPGSFTGLRIGFAAAKGLSLALGIPIIAIPTLDCIAYALSIWPGLVVPVQDAKKGCFFAALYRGGERLTDYMDIDPESLLFKIEAHKANTEEKVVITGPGAPLFLSRTRISPSGTDFFMDPLYSRGRSTELLQIAEKSFIIDNSEGLYSGPLYIRKSDAEINLGILEKRSVHNVSILLTDSK